ncbi:MAG: hypothetical protein ACKOGQ_05810, partial [Actinomycetota bacterium]
INIGEDKSILFKTIIKRHRITFERIAESELGFPAFNSLLDAHSDNANQSAQKSELTSTLAAYGSSLLALEVLRIADTGSSNLHQKTMLISMLNNLEPQITSWERSPRCGCNWS